LAELISVEEAAHMHLLLRILMENDILMRFNCAHNLSVIQLDLNLRPRAMFWHEKNECNLIDAWLREQDAASFIFFPRELDALGAGVDCFFGPSDALRFSIAHRLLAMRLWNGSCTSLAESRMPLHGRARERNLLRRFIIH